MNDLQRLGVLERRKTTLTSNDVKLNAWVRVKGNLEYVKLLCANGLEGADGREELGGENQASPGVGVGQQQPAAAGSSRQQPAVAVGVGAGVVSSE